MNTVSRKPRRDRASTIDGPYFIFHSSFEEPDAERDYGSVPAEYAEPLSFMPDDITRSWTKRMHYAAWRASTAGNQREAARWRGRYYDCRDRIVLGNRKLTFRAVQKWKPPPQLADDLAGECQIVLIKAVAAFNPWLGIRFSTYTFTCLMRALSRLTQRHAADRLSRWLPLGSLPCGEPRSAISEGPSGTCIARLEEYLGAEHALLTPREKTVLIWRYQLETDVSETGTLEQIGRRLGLSKERIRQVQSTALGKLRAALLAEPSDSRAKMSGRAD